MLAGTGRKHLNEFQNFPMENTIWIELPNKFCQKLNFFYNETIGLTNQGLCQIYYTHTAIQLKIDIVEILMLGWDTWWTCSLSQTIRPVLLHCITRKPILILITPKNINLNISHEERTHKVSRNSENHYRVSWDISSSWAEYILKFLRSRLFCFWMTR